MGDFYESHPYPPPADDLDAYRRAWDDGRRRAESHLLWPSEPYRDDRTILVAGCGTTQAAHYAVRWPHARVVGIDVSASSIAYTQELKAKHGLENLEVFQLAVEHASELAQKFDHVICTGVLHHLPDPDAGLRALHDVLAPAGALHLMVYAPYGRAGVYMLQDYCRRLGIGWTEAEIARSRRKPQSASTRPSDRIALAQITRLCEPSRRSRCAASPSRSILLGAAVVRVPRARRVRLWTLGASGAVSAVVRRAGFIAASIPTDEAVARRAVRGDRALPRNDGASRRGGVSYRFSERSIGT